tara:strand:+ start:233 stop:484 length:252 start_codon:yes stop_codon:yes gene_type:complete
MKTMFLSLTNEGLLEIMDYDSRNLELTLDIMNEYDKSLEEWNKVKANYNGSRYAVSSAIDFPSEFGVDDAILNSFINSMLGKS